MNKTSAIILAAAVIILGLAIYFSPSTTNNTKTSMDTTKTDNSSSDMTGLKIEDSLVGTGAEAVPGKKLSMHYVGTLLNGTKFDSSRDRGTPFEFTLGAGQVIQGWDQGIVGMKVGGKRKLTIPAPLAYGEHSPTPAIPPNSTLVFEVELLDVK